MHTNCPFSWYLISVISLFESALYLYINAFVVSPLLAFSISIIFMLDSTNAPPMFTSAIAKYFPSTDISAATAIVDARYVLNNSFPFLS